MSVTRSVRPEIRAYADANNDNRAAGSSSNRSNDTHATRRWSVSAHSAINVDLPYPAGAVIPTTRQSPALAASIRPARLTEPARRCGADNFASSSTASSSATVGPARAQ